MHYIIVCRSLDYAIIIVIIIMIYKKYCKVLLKLVQYLNYMHIYGSIDYYLNS